LPVPFTAREDDLEWLETCRQDVNGSLSAARIVGDHGVGKSRLLKEFLRMAAAAGDVVVQTGPDPWWAEGGDWTLRRAIAELAGLPPNGGGPSDWGAATPEARQGLSDLFGNGSRGESKRHVWSKPGAGTLSPEDRRFIAAEALRWAITRAHQNARHHRV